MCPTDFLYSKALGITDDVERLSLKGSRKKKGKKLDEDFVVSLLEPSAHGVKPFLMLFP
jgi:hypothetical protein